MNQIYHHYTKWEDWQNGMYGLIGCQDLRYQEHHIQNAHLLLADCKRLYEAMIRVVGEWVCSAEVNLTNRNRNRQAWLGQAACCLIHNVPEGLTKYAWHRLSPIEQLEANFVADIVTAQFEYTLKEKEICQSGQSVLTF